VDMSSLPRVKGRSLCDLRSNCQCFPRTAARRPATPAHASTPALPLAVFVITRGVKCAFLCSDLCLPKRVAG
jgi:hypothetical protein